ncbi:MAG: PAS domain-containing protein [Dehalococcoidales bacterium]|nr:PAS domain-containing protein [Dehalococcoidales bacterium]
MDIKNKIRLPRFDGELEVNLERRYRLQSLPGDIKQATGAIAIILIPTVLFLINDYFILGQRPLFYYLLAFRLVFLLNGIIVFSILRHLSSPDRYDRLVFQFGLWAIALITFINYTRPSDYTGHVFIDIVILLIMYLGIPAKFLYRTVIALLFTLGCLVHVSIAHVYIPVPDLIAILFALAGVNLGGMFLSHLLYSYRRRQFIAHLEIVREMEELKKAEEEISHRNTLLNALINSPGDIMIFSLDNELRYTAFNETHRGRMKELWRLDISHGMKMTDVITNPLVREKVRSSLETALAGESLTRTEYFPEHNSWIEYNYNPIRQENGRIIGVTGFNRDITQQKAAETAAMETESLRRLNRAKSELLANVSHELRTPLASIKGFIETLLATDVKWTRQQQMDFLESADKEADHLTLLIRNLLDMSRIDSGKLNLEIREYSFQNIIDSADSRLKALTRNHKLRIDISAGLPPVKLDKMRIAQVITNLVENAAKFSPEGSPIEIKAQSINGTLQVSVSDQGIGISEEELRNLFNRFYQAENVVSGKTRGTGLGLSICKGIVEAHGGTIQVESALNRGSVFSFFLPLS